MNETDGIKKKNEAAATLRATTYLLHGYMVIMHLV